jgi:hypothetical protein
MLAEGKVMVDVNGDKVPVEWNGDKWYHHPPIVFLQYDRNEFLFNGQLFCR